MTSFILSMIVSMIGRKNRADFLKFPVVCFSSRNCIHPGQLGNIFRKCYNTCQRKSMLLLDEVVCGCFFNLTYFNK